MGEALWNQASPADYLVWALLGVALVVLQVALEAVLDEWRDRRHQRDHGWLEHTVDTLIEQRDRIHGESDS